MASKCHSSHVLRSLGPFLFCDKCGALGSARVVHLAGPCANEAPSASAAARLGRLREGRHPESGVSIGVPSALPAAQQEILRNDDKDRTNGGKQ